MKSNADRPCWEDAAVDMGKTISLSLRYRITRGMETFLVRRVDTVVTICEGLRNDLLARGISDNRLYVVPNALALEKFKPCEKDADLIRRYRLQDRLVVGFIGSIFDFEGLDMLIRAAQRILPDHPDVTFLLVCGGPEESALQAMAKGSGFGDRILFTGRVPHDVVREHYSVIDVFVYPSLSLRNI